MDPSGFEPEAPAFFREEKFPSLAKAMLYQAELQAHKKGRNRRGF